MSDDDFVLADASAGQVTITWPTVESARYYIVYRNNWPMQIVKPGETRRYWLNRLRWVLRQERKRYHKKPKYVPKKLPPLDTYKYVVTAVNAL